VTDTRLSTAELAVTRHHLLGGKWTVHAGVSEGTEYPDKSKSSTAAVRADRASCCRWRLGCQNPARGRCGADATPSCISAEAMWKTVTVTKQGPNLIGANHDISGAGVRGTESAIPQRIGNRRKPWNSTESEFRARHQTACECVVTARRVCRCTGGDHYPSLRPRCSTAFGLADNRGNGIQWNNGVGIVTSISTVPVSSRHFSTAPVRGLSVATGPAQTSNSKAIRLKRRSAINLAATNDATHEGRQYVRLGSVPAISVCIPSAPTYAGIHNNDFPDRQVFFFSESTPEPDGEVVDIGPDRDQQTTPNGGVAPIGGVLADLAARLGDHIPAGCRRNISAWAQRHHKGAPALTRSTAAPESIPRLRELRWPPPI